MPRIARLFYERSIHQSYFPGSAEFSLRALTPSPASAVFPVFRRRHCRRPTFYVPVSWKEQLPRALALAREVGVSLYPPRWHCQWGTTTVTSSGVPASCTRQAGLACLAFRSAAVLPEPSGPAAVMMTVCLLAGFSRRCACWPAVARSQPPSSAIETTGVLPAPILFSPAVARRWRMADVLAGLGDSQPCHQPGLP